MITRRLLLAAPALAQPRPVLVASFSILGDMLSQLAPEGADIRVIAGPEADAHAFQPRPSHAEALRGAALAVRNGQGFDGWFDRLARAANFQGRLVTALEGPGLRVGDPHGWQDVSVARGYIRRIAAGLGAPNRLTAYDARLEALDGWIRAQIDRVPPERRVVLTSHDSFGYFGAAYGVRFVAPQGVSTGAEPSAQGVAALLRQIRAQRITAVFMDHLGNPATLRRLAAEAGVAVLGRLYAETLSAPGGPAPDYEAMMRHNVGLMVPAMLGA